MQDAGPAAYAEGKFDITNRLHLIDAGFPGREQAVARDHARASLRTEIAPSPTSSQESGNTTIRMPE